MAGNQLNSAYSWPSDYDHAHIETDPNALKRDSFEILGLIDQFVDQVKQFAKTGKDLKLGWVGKTSEEANDFNDSWSSTMVALFGKEGDDPGKYPPPGHNCLGKMSAVVSGASDNFRTCESSVVDMFKGFDKDAGNGTKTSGNKTPSDINEIGPGSS